METPFMRRAGLGKIWKSNDTGAFFGLRSDRKTEGFAKRKGFRRRIVFFLYSPCLCERL